jgi:hypothetical protein
VTVEVTQDQDQFLPSESVPVAVRITNRSGRTLHLGADNHWLTFTVEGRDGLIVLTAGDPPVAGEFELPSSKVATKRLDLAPWFGLTQPGRYSVTATVNISEWGQEVTSKPRFFTVINGTRLWESEVGVPNTNVDGVPEIRRYALQQANYLKANIRLYLRITDITGTKIFTVAPIGNLVSFSRPEVQIDEQSRLHVLFQKGPRSFSYNVFNTDGELLKRQNYEFDESRPRLALEPVSGIKVAGGKQVVTPYDVPPPPESPEPSTNAPPSVVSTNGIAAGPEKR